MSAHSGWRAQVSRGIAPISVSTFCPARGPDVAVGEVVLIDYTVDLTARAAAACAPRPPMPGPLFMGEPDPPELDAQGRFWAALVRADSPAAAATGKAGAVRPAPAPGSAGAARRAGGLPPPGPTVPARPDRTAAETVQTWGPVSVPAAAQYPWRGDLIAK
jgi:hypothetical protein